MSIAGDTHLSYPELSLYGALAAAAQKAPSYTALDFQNRKTSFKNLLKEADAAAAALTASGCRAGDTVTVCMPNLPQALVFFYAISRIGGTANMVHPESARNEIAFCLRLNHSRLILVLDRFYEVVRDAAALLDYPVEIVIAKVEDALPAILVPAYALTEGRRTADIPGSGPGILWKDFLKRGKKVSLGEPQPFSRDHTGVILYSGGISGKPKGIALSDYSFNACCVQAAAAIARPFEPGMSMLSCMPCFHGFGLCMNLHAALMFGVACILMPSFHIKTYAKLLTEKKPNYIAGVPTIFEALIGLDLGNLRLDFLQGVFCGGDTLPIRLKREVDAFLQAHGATVQIREGYGLTESVTASCLTPTDEYREGSIGLPFPDIDYAIVRPGTAELLPAGETGEIVMTGPTLMQGYLGEPEETADCMKLFPDGRVWLYTGDCGCMDADGFVYFKGRRKRMLITNGFNVYPAQLEKILCRSPLVKEAYVYGVPDPRRQQRIQAAVVLREGTPGDSETKNAILEYLKTELARFEMPRMLEFVSQLPAEAERP